MHARFLVNRKRAEEFLCIIFNPKLRVCFYGPCGAMFRVFVVDGMALHVQIIALNFIMKGLLVSIVDGYNLPTRIDNKAVQ
ncbi:hypothetical protein GALMADRAFT_246608 [Galerina marginata CBS 339.88]|uniref:Uncharacterized protein n=1 Tax=Galerina marginata (strain CBS 339.88) TaxID=685588 RepID=A0A067TE63_GALM3|nr:hypothetical protein GALMADRAFT_246608 [Galerina marginata CBS 339.88]